MISKPNKVFFLWLIFALIGLPLNAQIIEVPEGDFRVTEPEDFLANNYSSKFYNELYTYQIQLDNGVQVVYTFSINDFGSFKSRVTGGKMMVRWLDGEDYVANKEYPVEKFINEVENNSIILHPERNYWAKGSFEDEHVINFRTTKEGVAYDIQLVLYDIIPGLIWDDGVFKVKGNDFGITLLIPDAKVKGYVSINGEKIEASGRAMMDLTYQKNLSTKFLHKGYRIKSGDSQNGYVLNFYTIKEDEDRIPFGYGIRFIDGEQQIITPETIEFKDSYKTHGVWLNTEFGFTLSDGKRIDFKLTEHFNSYSILDELGGISKTVAKRILRGEVIEINGVANVNNQDGYFSFLVIR